MHTLLDLQIGYTCVDVHGMHEQPCSTVQGCTNQVTMTAGMTITHDRKCFSSAD